MADDDVTSISFYIWKFYPGGGREINESKKLLPLHCYGLSKYRIARFLRGGYEGMKGHAERYIC